MVVRSALVSFALWAGWIWAVEPPRPNLENRQILEAGNHCLGGCQFWIWNKAVISQWATRACDFVRDEELNIFLQTSDYANTIKYPRLRFGIGNNFKDGKQIDFVLQKWNDDESKNLSKLIEHNSSIALHYVKHGIDNTMNKFN